jgi:HAE1 family hydrophobic/amphiphilic exporter-1
MWSQCAFATFDSRKGGFRSSKAGFGSRMLVLSRLKVPFSNLINASNSILYGGLLALLVLLIFLRDLRSTMVIAIAIPISVVATFALMFFSGFTLNLMTLGGLALGVGMMVDSSVVVLENIFRNRRESGLSPVEASINGANEVTSAVIAGTITTLVIFLPLIFV